MIMNTWFTNVLLNSLNLFYGFFYLLSKNFLWVRFNNQIEIKINNLNWRNNLIHFIRKFLWIQIELFTLIRVKLFGCSHTPTGSPILHLEPELNLFSTIRIPFDFLNRRIKMNWSFWTQLCENVKITVYFKENISNWIFTSSNWFETKEILYSYHFPA